MHRGARLHNPIMKAPVWTSTTWPSVRSKTAFLGRARTHAQSPLDPKLQNTPLPWKSDSVLSRTNWDAVNRRKEIAVLDTTKIWEVAATCLQLLSGMARKTDTERHDQREVERGLGAGGHLQVSASGGFHRSPSEVLPGMAR